MTTTPKKKNRWLVPIVILLIVAVLVGTGLYRVGQGEEALVITFG